MGLTHKKLCHFKKMADSQPIEMSLAVLTKNSTPKSETAIAADRLQHLLSNSINTPEDLHAIAENPLFRTEISQRTLHFNNNSADQSVENVLKNFDAIGPCLQAAYAGCRDASSSASVPTQKMVGEYQTYLKDVKIGSKVFVDTSLAICSAHKDAVEYLNEGVEFIDDALDGLRSATDLAVAITKKCDDLKNGADSLLKLCKESCLQLTDDQNKRDDLKADLKRKMEEMDAEEKSITAAMNQTKIDREQHQAQARDQREKVLSAEAETRHLIRQANSFGSQMGKLAKSLINDSFGTNLDTDGEQQEIELMKQQAKEAREAQKLADEKEFELGKEFLAQMEKQTKLAADLKNSGGQISDVEKSIQSLQLAYSQLTTVQVAISNVKEFYENMLSELRNNIAILEKLTDEDTGVMNKLLKVSLNGTKKGAEKNEC